MFDNTQTIIEFLEAVLPEGGVVDFAGEYGEPGYGSSNTQLVVLATYWCRCDKYADERHPDSPLHDVAVHYPHAFRKLEELGVELEWYDEWIVDHLHDKAYRTSADSYSWQPSYVVTEDGEMLTVDDDLEEWIAYAKNNPRLCIPSNVATGADLIRAGFTEYNGTYENGWHPGQTDDPAVIEAEIRRFESADDDEYGDNLDVVFCLSETSQFYVKFEAYYRSNTEEV